MGFKSTIINSFTTFLLLSFSKILFVSFTLFYTIHIDYNIDLPKSCVLYYDPTVKCHGWEFIFIIFSVAAVCVLVLFILFPTILLILYPTRLCRRCVSCCGFRRLHALHMFVESFQGQYKDGTNGTRDFRMASASFLILRALIITTFLHRNYYNSTSSYQIGMLASVSCFYAIARPYKNSMTTVDILILFLVEMLSLVTINSTPKHFTYAILIPTLMLGVPHMVLIFYICHILAKKAGITQYLRRKYETFVQAIRDTETDVEDESCTGSLPDRLINPGEYEPLLLTTGGHTAAELTVNKEAVNEEPRRPIPVYTYSSFN